MTEKQSKISILSNFPPESLQRVIDEVPNVELGALPDVDSLDEQTLETAAGTDVVLIPPWDDGSLQPLLDRGLRWVHTIGTGVDRMPLEVFRNCTLTCSRGASSQPISEWVLAVMLAFEKQLPQTWLSEPPEAWSSASLGTLHGKTLGLLGFGGIGTSTASHAANFGMDILAFRRSTQQSPLNGVTMTDNLQQLMQQSQHIVLSLPLTPSTRHIINEETLAYIPAGAGIHLVNPSRGALVDCEALRVALEDGRVACASLDTVDPEPLPEGHWLYHHPQVRLSAHISWNTPNAFDLLLDTFIDNLQRYRNGDELNGIVDIDHGY